ncbi:MAG: UDP-2,3-diacylglucosamine diphosphatase [Pseudomonadota bacterium]
MTVAFISDLHLTPSRPHSDQLFCEFADRAKSHVERLYILGDLFEYWVGDDASADLGYKAIESALRALSDSGTQLFFMHGNRDFLIGDAFAERTGVTILPDPSIVQLNGQRILLSHGDALCTDDIEHQQKRREMLSAEWKSAFQSQSVDQRIAFADRIRSKSDVDKQTKPLEIMDVNQNAVESMMRDNGVDKLIHGHTHKPAVHEFLLDGETARRYVLGDWYTQKSVLFFADGVLTLH